MATTLQPQTLFFQSTKVDWAGDISNHHSTSAYLVIYLKGPIAWSCVKQGLIAMLTTKAKLNTIHCCINQFVYMTKIFNTIRLQAKTTPILYNNNQSALAIIHSGQTNFHSVKKHYNMKLK